MTNKEKTSFIGEIDNNNNSVVVTCSIIIFRLHLLWVRFVLQKQQHQPLAQKYSAFTQVQNNITDKASVENTETLINKGLALYVLRKYQEAISLFDKALAIEPNNTMILINKQLAQQEQQLQPN